MFRFIILLLSLALANVVIGDDLESDESKCEPRYSRSSPDFPCNGYLSTDFNCNNTFFDVSDTSFYDCSNVNFFWNYPMHNLTVIIKAANYTNLKQPFTVSLSNVYSLSTYRIYPNEQEVLISNTTAGQIVQTSDRNYQIVLKFQGPKRLTFYGASIEYQIAPIYTSVSSRIF